MTEQKYSHSPFSRFCEKMRVSNNKKPGNRQIGS